MPTPITRFKCEYCRKKSYASIYSARDHEKTCFWNPEVRSCVTCSNLTVDGNCLFTQQPAFSKGHPVYSCKDWIEGSFEDEEYE
jgi:hypothetical protein